VTAPRTIFWAQLPPPSVGGLRRRGPVTCGFAGSRPAPSRRPCAVSSGCGVARRRARAQACRTARSTDLPVGARAHLPSRRPHASFSAGRARLRHPTRTFTRGHPQHSPRAPVPIACRPSARPASRLLRARLAVRRPGSGPSARSSGSRLGAFRRCCRGSPLVSPSRPPGGETALAFGSLLAANKSIAETSAVYRADPEGSESPFTPHRVPSRA
jgi:hypothetical protein